MREVEEQLKAMRANNEKLNTQEVTIFPYFIQIFVSKITRNQCFYRWS